MSVWKEIGKNILKSSAVMYGSRVVADRVLPAAEDFGKKAWRKVKETKKTKKVTHKPAKQEVVFDSNDPNINDADFRDKE